MKSDLEAIPGAFLEALVASGLLAPEEASAILKGASKEDPARAVMERGFASPDEIRTALDLARTLSGTGLSPESAGVLERRRAELDRWIEGARTIAGPPPEAPGPATTQDAPAAARHRADPERTVDATQPPRPPGGAEIHRPSARRAARPPPGSRPPPPAPAPLGELDQGDPARSVLFGRSARGPASPDRYLRGVFVRREAGRDVHAGKDLDLARDVELHEATPGTSRGALLAAGALLASIGGPAVPILFGSGENAAGEPFLVLSPPPGDSIANRLASIPAGVSGAPARVELARAVVAALRAVGRAHEKGAPHLGISPERAPARTRREPGRDRGAGPRLRRPGRGEAPRSPRRTRPEGRGREMVHRDRPRGPLHPAASARGSAAVRPGLPRLSRGPGRGCPCEEAPP